MDVIQRARRGGKTTEILRWFMRDPEHRYIISPTEAEASMVRAELEARDVERRWLTHVVTPAVIRDSRARGMPHDIEFGIDDVDAVLGYLLGAKVSVVTYT
jgi:hypothetical protein